MSNTVKLRKGLDIKLVGEAEKLIVDAKAPQSVALKPIDFHGLVPRVILKPGDTVKRGEVVFYDKYNEDIKFVSPVSGTLTEIVRGERRRILEVRIEASGTDEVVKIEPVKIESLSRDEVKKILLENGLWPFIKQRPLDKVANPDIPRKDSSITAFDSSPLGPDYDYNVHGRVEWLRLGIAAIEKSTVGKVNLILSATGA